MELRILLFAIIIFVLNLMSYLFIVDHPVRSVALFAFSYFLVIPLIGIYLCWHYISKGLKVMKSVINTTGFFFVVLLVSYIVGTVLWVFIRSEELDSLSLWTFNLVKSLITFTIYAFVGSLFFSFIFSKLKSKKLEQ